MEQYYLILTDFQESSPRAMRYLRFQLKSALVIQNRTPAATYILPPGQLKVKFIQDVKGVSGDFLHLGGYAFVNPYNSFI